MTKEKISNLVDIDECKKISDHSSDRSVAQRGTARQPNRRLFNASLVAASLASMLPTVLAQSVAAKSFAGHRLAFSSADRAGEEVKPADLVLGEDPVLAYPIAPDGTVLEGRVNLMAIMRVPADRLPAEVAPYAPEGIVAFSAICTHYGCPVTKCDAVNHHLVCNCHGSAFDPAKRGAVIKGPAVRRLPMLPLMLNGDALLINGALDGPIGPPT